MYYILVVIYSIKFVASNDSVIFSSGGNQSYNSNICISNIMKKNFLCGKLITFVNPSSKENELIKYANVENICYKTNMRSFYADDYNWYIWTNVYIITTKNFMELCSGLRVLTRNVFWNPRAKFIVQVDNLENEEEIETIFRLFSKYNIYDVILIQLLENDALVYTYYPFNNSNCGNYVDKIILGTCRNVESIYEFPNNVLRNLNNCRVTVVASDDIPNFISESSNFTVYGKFVPGLEQFVLDTTATHEGFTIQYKVFDPDEVVYGVVLQNRTSTGLLNYLDTDRADLAAGGYSLTKNRVELFDFLSGFNYASYHLFIPTIRSHAFNRLYKEFTPRIWLLIGSSLILVIVVCLILKRLLNDRTNSILNLWGYFFGNANAGMSRNIRFRKIIFFWSWFTFFIINFYNTALYSLITVHVHERQHSISANNLKTLPYKPCISNNTRMFFKFALNQDLPVGEPIHNCTFTEGALRYVANTKKYYAIEMEYSYSLKEYEFLDQEGKPYLEPWSFSSYHIIVMYADRGFRYRQIFQKYANRMFEGGLIKNHLKTIHMRSYSVIKSHPKAFKGIDVLDLGLHFCVLLSGYILSFFCFILEIWYHNITLEERSKKTKKLNK